MWLGRINSFGTATIFPKTGQGRERNHLSQSQSQSQREDYLIQAKKEQTQLPTYK
jgi:hypothetical protein